MTGAITKLSGPAVVLILAGFAISASAATEELQRKAMPSEFWSGKTMTVEARREFAVGVLDYWKAVSERIPRLSPKERDWIKTELSTSDTARFVAAMNRKEGALYLAADAVDFCVKSYREIIPLLGKDSRSEALAWVNSMRCYASTDELRIHFYKAGLISEPRVDKEIKMQMFSIWWQSSLRAIEGCLSE
jgi:hypothetical protein